MVTLFLVVLGFLAGWTLAWRSGVQTFSGRMVFAGAWSAAQVVFLQTWLGALGLLSRPWVAASCLVLDLALGAFCLWGFQKRPGELFRTDLLGWNRVLKAFRHPEVFLIGILALIGWVWAVAAAYYLPPRSVDDLCHHLSPVFAAATQGHFALLPLDLRPWFAYPLNADLLALFPVLMSGTITWADGAQLLTGLLAAITIASLARSEGASRRSSALAGLLLLVLPVTLRQATSAYTDVTLAAFFGVAAYGAVRFRRDGMFGSLLLCGLGSGLLAGTKYNFLYALIGLSPLIVAGLLRPPDRKTAWKRAALGLALPALALCAFWYLRNWLVLGNPFYPFSLGLGPVRLFPSALPPGNDLLGSPSFLQVLLSDPGYLASLVITDTGAGGPDGGFGPLFWGGVFPLGFWHFGVSIWRAGRKKSFDSLTLGLVFFSAWLPFLVNHEATAHLSLRFLLTAAVPGLALLAVALDRLQKEWPVLWGGARAVIILVSALAFMTIGGTSESNERKQLMNFAPAAAEPGDFPDWHFAHEASFSVGAHAEVWELLDMLSAPAGKDVRPLWVYASGPFPAGFFGSRLQNKIWNLETNNRPSLPDILFIYFPPPQDPTRFQIWGRDRFTEEDALTRPDLWDLVFLNRFFSVYLRRDLLAPGHELRQRLIHFLTAVFPEDVALAATLNPVPAQGTIFPLGRGNFGLKALELQGKIPTKVVLSRELDVEAFKAGALTTGPTFCTYRPGEEGLTVVGKMKRGDHEIWLYAPPRSAP